MGIALPAISTRLWQVLATCFLLTGLVRTATAQPTAPVEDAVADSLFSAALDVFQSGEYGVAHEIFRAAADRAPLNTTTTAAAIMAIKSSFRSGDFRTVSIEASAFLSSYPSSGYVDDARELLTRAGTALNREDEDIIPIGVILSMDQQDVAQTQALFNGLYTAVQEYNQNSLERRIRIIFRDTRGRPTGAEQAVSELADQGVQFIVGAIFSEEAIAAAQAAERRRVVYIAPLATDERVTTDLRYSFQANPSISMRGRLMARFAVNGLRLRTLGVIASQDPERISERLTDSFIEEASRLGAELKYVSVLPSSSQFVSLSQTVSPDTLVNIEALYVPVADVPAEPAIGAIFSSLDRLRTDVRLLGNRSYHEIPMVTDASRYRVTYSNDYFVQPDRQEVQAFASLFEASFSAPPNRLAYTGYDVTSFMLRALDFSGDDPLVDVLPTTPVYEGLATRIGFEGGNVNRAMFFHRYTDGELQLLR